MYIIFIFITYTKLLTQSCNGVVELFGGSLSVLAIFPLKGHSILQT